MKHITMKDIAKEAGVSLATVSYALNGNTGVSAAMRQKILQIAEEFQYVPHMSAQILARKTTPIVCGLVRSFSGVFSNELWDEMQDEFQKAGYLLVAVNRLLPELIGSDLFRGIVVLDFDITDQEQAIIDALHAPTVYLVGTHSPAKAQVMMDNQQAITLAYGELAKSVHQRLCILSGREPSINNYERLNTVKKLYSRDHPGTDVDSVVFSADFSYANAYDMSADLLARFDSFLCFNDVMAMAIYKGAFEKGLVVGRDLSISGFDNSILAFSASPGLTSVGFDGHQWAQEAVHQFKAAVRHGSDNIPATLISPTMNVRESIRYKEISEN